MTDPTDEEVQRVANAIKDSCGGDRNSNCWGIFAKVAIIEIRAMDREKAECNKQPSNMRLVLEDALNGTGKRLP